MAKITITKKGTLPSSYPAIPCTTPSPNMLSQPNKYV